MPALIKVSKHGYNFYTEQWLKYMAHWSGIQEEEVELVSICDLDEIGILLEPKQRPRA